MISGPKGPLHAIVSWQLTAERKVQMTPQWKDTTSYRQGERGKVEPSSWSLTGTHVQITVHRYIGCGDAWFVTCPQARIETSMIDGPTIDAAKEQALHKVRDRLRMFADDADALAS